MHTIATLHVHPTTADPFRVFEIRRLAREAGCTFAAPKIRLQPRPAAPSFDPNDGGRAA